LSGAPPACALGRSQVRWVERVSQPSFSAVASAVASEAEAHGAKGAEWSVGGGERALCGVWVTGWLVAGCLCTVLSTRRASDLSKSSPAAADAQQRCVTWNAGRQRWQVRVLLVDGTRKYVGSAVKREDAAPRPARPAGVHGTGCGAARGRGVSVLSGCAFAGRAAPGAPLPAEGDRQRRTCGAGSQSQDQAAADRGSNCGYLGSTGLEVHLLAPVNPQVSRRLSRGALWLVPLPGRRDPIGHQGVEDVAGTAAQAVVRADSAHPCQDRPGGGSGGSRGGRGQKLVSVRLLHSRVPGPLAHGLARSRGPPSTPLASLKSCSAGRGGCAIAIWPGTPRVPPHPPPRWKVVGTSTRCTPSWHSLPASSNSRPAALTSLEVVGVGRRVRVWGGTGSLRLSCVCASFSCGGGNPRV
jgi:hypothetical protein